MRNQITNDSLNEAIRNFKNKLSEIIELKGSHSFSSRHEILGLLEEEFLEFKQEVHSGTLNELKSELLDIAIIAIFGVACINQGEIEW